MDRRRRLPRHRRQKHLESCKIPSTACEQPSTTQPCKKYLRSARSQRCSLPSSSRDLRTSNPNLGRRGRRRVRMIKSPNLVDRLSLVCSTYLSLLAYILTSHMPQTRSDKIPANQPQLDPSPPRFPRPSCAPPSSPRLLNSPPLAPVPVPPSPPSPPLLSRLSSLPCRSHQPTPSQELLEQTRLHRRTEVASRLLVPT